MKTLTAIPLALTILASAFAAPAASAAVSAKTFQVTFAYNRADSADRIYANLRDAAYEACKDAVGPLVRMRRLLGVCTRDVMNAGIDAIARPDIADLHRQRVHARRI